MRRWPKSSRSGDNADRDTMAVNVVTGATALLRCKKGYVLLPAQLGLLEFKSITDKAETHRLAHSG